MHPVGGKAQKHIALGHACGQFGAALHRAHGKACKVKIALVIHARHFRRLTTDQRAAAGFTPCGNAGDDAGRLFDIQLAGGKVVEEQQGFGPLAHQIVHAHGHQINADGVDIAGVDGDAQLGAHTVGCRHKDGVVVARRLEVKERAKTTKAPHGAGAIGALGRRLDPVNQRISGIDIHPRICIGQAIMSGGHVENPMLAAIACPLRHLPRARNA